MKSLDFQAAYLLVPIHRDHRHFLLFVFQVPHYQWKVLSFGIYSALWLFTCLTQPVMKFLHLSMIMFDSYLIQIHVDADILCQQLNFMCRLLMQLGKLINVNKSEVIPTQYLQFIRVLFDNRQGMMFIPNVWWVKIQRYFLLALKQPLRLCKWQQFLWSHQCFLVPFFWIDHSISILVLNGGWSHQMFAEGTL